MIATQTSDLLELRQSPSLRWSESPRAGSRTWHNHGWHV